MSKRYGCPGFYKIEDLRWWFHDFKRATINGYNNTDVKKAFGYLNKKIKGLKKVTKRNAGTKTYEGNIKAFNVRNLLLDSFKTVLFDSIDPQIYDELITNSTHDLVN